MTTLYPAGRVARPKTSKREPVEGRRDAPADRTWRDVLLTVFAVACMALPLGIAAADNLGGVR